MLHLAPSASFDPGLTNSTMREFSTHSVLLKDSKASRDWSSSLEKTHPQTEKIMTGSYPQDFACAEIRERCILELVYWHGCILVFDL